MRSHNLFFFFAFLSFATISVAQIDLPVYDYTEKKVYNIAEIKVEGAVNRDRNAIKSIASLREGKEITIPGDDIPNAIKALWKLKLFEDVEIIQEKIDDNLIYLKIVLTDRPTLSRYSIRGENKNKHEELTDIIDPILLKGSIVTEDLKDLTIQKLKKNYQDKGFLHAEVSISEVEDEIKENAVRLVFDIEKKSRVKISDIVILGNKKFTDKKLKRKMKETKEKGTIFKKSKFVAEEFKIDKGNIVDFYNSHGYRDAAITHDTLITRPDGDLIMLLTVDEGEQYFFRNITWKGNSKYTTEQLLSLIHI